MNVSHTPINSALDFPYWTSLRSSRKVSPSSTGSTCASQWKMLLIKVFSVICLTAVCAAEETEDATVMDATLTMVTADPVVSVPVPPAPSLQLKSARLDVFPSEKVEFSCSVTGSSDWTITWSRDGNDVQDSDPNVSLAAYGSVITITAATQTYSGSYTCKGQHKTRGITTADSNALKLTVHEPPLPTLQLQSAWLDVFPSEKVEFSCSVTGSSDWTITWSRDGNDIQDSDPNVSLSENGSVITITAATQTYSGSYTCKGQQKTRGVTTADSNALKLTVHANKPKPTVSRSPNFDTMFPTESVSFICTVALSSGWEYLWYHNGEEVQAANDYNYTIKSVDHPNSGQYQCKAKRGKGLFYTEQSEIVSLQVSDPPKPSLRLVTPWNDVFENELVGFRCEVNSSDWSFTWYKNQHEQPLKEDSEQILRLDPKEGSFNITSVTKSYEGDYACKAHLGSREVSSGFSNTVNVTVYDNVPKPSVSKNPAFNPMFVGETVIFTCNVDVSTEWEYQWYKDGKKLSKTGKILSIRLDTSDVGKYSCVATRGETSTDKSEETQQDVSEIPVPSLTQLTAWFDVFPAESVKLSCGMSKSSNIWIYTWYKDGQKIQADDVVSFDLNGATLSINSASAVHAGKYSCSGDMKGRSVHSTASSELTLTVYENKPKPLMTQQPDDPKVYTGEAVSFECKVELSSGWQYLWYKDRAQVAINSSTFKIYGANLLSSGSYKCMATRGKTMYNTSYSDERILRISEIPVPSLTQQSPWLDVFPTENVKLSCDMDRSSNWRYTWYKDEQQLKAENAVSFESDSATLSISSASASHRGRYRCSATLKTRHVNSNFSSELTLDVYDTIPRVTLVQNPEHNVMHTGDSVSFNCHINVSSGWEYLWYKDGIQLAESGNSHTIRSVLTQNTGSYRCQTKRNGSTAFLSDQSQNVRLEIKERPQANIDLLTGWSEVFSTDSLVLQCGVQGSSDEWNYTWFKGNEEINLLPSKKHTVTPQDDPEQSLYTCKGIQETKRPFYSKTSDPFKTKNLLLKRRVLLSISGCIVFGIAAVFLGCIILRAIRKPAEDECKTEEPDLFVSMSKLKDRDDTACPLVQYITEAGLNSSPKEGEENGTICSETTPLPITSQEDQAAATETEDAKEENGGLVSFKQ